MFKKSYSPSTSSSTVSSLGTGLSKLQRRHYYEDEGEVPLDILGIEKEANGQKCISEGDYLPYGPRMYYETSENLVRMKDIGENNRVLLIGVIGSYTPDCWNRHFFQVLKKLRYYEERNVDFVCCVSTNDAYTQKAWGEFLGCDDKVLMWSDVTGRFTKAMGMNFVVPWLDNVVRSKRYVLLADDMLVTKIIKSPSDTSDMRWQCKHFGIEHESEEQSEESEDSWV